MGYLNAFSLRKIGALTLPTALAATLAASPVSASVFLIQSSAYDVGVDLTVLGGVTATIGPFVQAAGIFPPVYNVSQTLLSATGTAALKTGGLLPLTLANIGVTTGAVSASASSPFTVAQTTTANSTVDDLALLLKTAGILPVTLLSVGATTITSTSSAAIAPVDTATGFSSIENLKISGSAIGVPIDLTGIVDPPVNDVIFNLAGLMITLNQQIVTGNGTGGGISIETNAIAIDFKNFALGTGLVNGDIIIADSVASVPEPATWIEMLVGFGAVGVMMLGRAKARKMVAA